METQERMSESARAMHSMATAPKPQKFMVDFLRETQESFVEVPFCPVDSLVLSSLVYLNLDEYRYGNVHGAESVPVIDILRFTPLRSMLSGGWLEDAEELPDFLRELACSRRYADLSVSLFANETAEIIEKQFCACTFTVGEKDGAPLAYLAFRGTDGTIAGWKEDFNLSYMPVIPSQKTATAYVSGVLSALPGEMPIYVGGHSKGGNLAEFAALTIDEGGYARIKRVFNHDGPSFLEAPSPRIDEPKFQAKLDKTVPESSVFGMILESRDDFRIVQSNAMGFFQHVPFTWIVDGCDFSTQRTLNNSAKMFDITLDRWLRSCSQHEREVFIDTMYDLITSSDAKSWADFQSSFMSNMATFMRDGRNLDDQTKEVMAHAIKNLGDVAGHTLRERLGATIERMKEAVPFIDTERDDAQSARKKN